MAHEPSPALDVPIDRALRPSLYDDGFVIEQGPDILGPRINTSLSPREEG